VAFDCADTFMDKSLLGYRVGISCNLSAIITLVYIVPQMIVIEDVG